MTHDHVAQREAALKVANAVRRQRGSLKRRIKDGEVKVQDVLREQPVPVYLETMFLEELLRAQRSWGHRKTNQFLWNHLQTKPTVMLRDLSRARRYSIAQILDEWNNRWRRKRDR